VACEEMGKDIPTTSASSADGRETADSFSPARPQFKELECLMNDSLTVVVLIIHGISD
jgi:hypothetical protein